MQKAYDTILQSEVFAGLVDQSSGYEPYRYECACCGEEVHIAALDSTKMVAHFRHLNGNNDVECENYLGQYGIISIDSHSRRSNRERAEFYFDNTNKIFSLGLRFSESEIQGYEQQNVDFELRTKDSDRPFYILKINSTNFSPNVPTMIPLSNFSFSYYLSNTHNGAKRKYDFFKLGNIPTFFKIQGNDREFKAKLVRNNVLYTNTQYFAAFQSPYSMYGTYEGVQISETFSFETMGCKFVGILLTIQKKTSQLDLLVKSWGYQLDANETLTLLWPPAASLEDISLIRSDYVFLYSSFDLLAHGNINVHSENIQKVASGISRVLVIQRVKVSKKNVEIIIEKRDQSLSDYDEVVLSENIANTYVVPNYGSYFLFNFSGTIPLSSGQVVLLTPNCEIKGYKFSYLISRICKPQKEELVGELLLKDILAHYKRTEVFNPTIFRMCVLSETASQYIEKCRKVGLINTRAKQYIKEGQL